MACVFGSLLSPAIGTTAPFSAISGAVISIALLGVDPLPPSAFTVSATLFVSNAALFHSCASASPGLRIPTAAASASTPPPVFNTSRRLASTRSSLEFPISGMLDFTVAPEQMRRKLVVSEASFADRSSLVEVDVGRATSGEDLRPQLAGVHRQVGINGAAVQVGGELHLQSGLF